jgi:hypothetical protein
MAQAILASLLASAMAATLVGRRASNAVSQGRCPLPCGSWHSGSLARAPGLGRARAEAEFERSKDKLGSISKQGDRYLRSLFKAGALAVVRYAKIHGAGHRPWLAGLLVRRPTEVAAIALANKIARMAWAMMARGGRYRETVALAT